MSERQFKDCDGDTWTEYAPGMLRLTECAGDRNQYTGIEASIEDTQADHGPLTEVRPDVDVRAVLAGVLEDMAGSADTLCGDADEMTREIGYRMKDIFEGKARELRVGSA
ncbi:hypothetical protein [Streptomyces sp. NPDC058280]|uniref:hypothetical protein n=1 Tax=Streptomyces sp. NPDC058280 TaxID=3346419 RepID=UPI0036EC3393